MPNRVIRDGFLDSEAIDGLSPEAECLYHRLLLACDDGGRMDGRPTIIAAKCYPLRRQVDEKAIAPWLSEVSKAGLLYFYTWDSKPYIQITKWQRCSNSQMSKYPDQKGLYRIVFVKLDTRLGQKEFVESSVLSHADPIRIPSDPIGIPPGCPPEPPSPSPYSVIRTSSSEEEGGVGEEGNEPNGHELELLPGEVGKSNKYADARMILQHLNAKAGKKFRETEEYLKQITACIKDADGDVDGIKVMIDRMVAGWKGEEKTRQWLRPSTLFRKSNFQEYYDDRNEPPPQSFANRQANGRREDPNFSNPDTISGVTYKGEQEDWINPYQRKATP
jgi:uncharacterized phage protein (TIGR02220 family)